MKKLDLLTELEQVVTRAKALQKLGIDICSYINPDRVIQDKPRIPLPPKKPEVKEVKHSELYSIILKVLKKSGKLKASEVLTILKKDWADAISNITSKDLPLVISAELTSLKQDGKVERLEGLQYQAI